MTEIYKISEGKIIISYSDSNVSVGLLGLNSGRALEKHSRPVGEELIQVCGNSVITLFNGEELIKEVSLGEGDKIEIPANQFHIHANTSDDQSFTLWKFEGDISDIIEDIRNNNPKIL